MRVHNQEIVRVFENGGVGVGERDRFGDGGVHSIGNLLDLEQRRLRWRGGLRPRLGGAEDALLEQGCARPACAKGGAQKASPVRRHA